MAKRPIINTRDEPHADEERYRRLHVIVGDSNLAEVSTYLKVGTTALVLAMVEDGALRKDLALEDPVRAIKEISHDTTCTRKVRLKRGTEVSAVELQREYLELAQAYYATVEQSPQVTDLLERWEPGPDPARRGPPPVRPGAGLGHQAGAPRGATPAGRGSGSTTSASACWICSTTICDWTRGCTTGWSGREWWSGCSADEEIHRAMSLPPTDTRAYFRGTCVRRFRAQVCGASWTSILLDTGRCRGEAHPHGGARARDAEAGGRDPGARGQRDGSPGATGRVDSDLATRQLGDWAIRQVRETGRIGSPVSKLPKSPGRPTAGSQPRRREACGLPFQSTRCGIQLLRPGAGARAGPPAAVRGGGAGGRRRDCQGCRWAPRFWR